METILVRGNSPGTLLVAAGEGPSLLINSDLSFTLYIGKTNAVSPARIDNAVPISPQSHLVVDGEREVYGIGPAAGSDIIVYKITGGLSFFQSGITGESTIINKNGLFLYNGQPTFGNLILSIAAVAGIDRFGNAYDTEFEVVDQASQRNINIVGDSILLQFVSSLGAFIGPDASHNGLLLNGPHVPIALPYNAWMDLEPGSSPSGTNSPIVLFSPGAVLSADRAFFKSSDSTVHALTAYQADTTGLTNAAINAISDNSNFSAVEVSGTETGRGTVKIAHHGYANGSDANAAAISIDQQTTVGGTTGTEAQGIFITSTTDNVPFGNAITVRYNNQDWFVVKGAPGAVTGIVGIGVATGHEPAGMLEIAQINAGAIGLYITALAGGTDLIQLKDSGGNLRFQINNAGNTLHRANMFCSTNVIIGSVSSDFGGAGSALTICHSTDPASNPAAGHIIIYVDAAGNLLARTSAGNVRTIAAV